MVMAFSAEQLRGQGVEENRLARAMEIVSAPDLIARLTKYGTTQDDCQCIDHKASGYVCKHMMAAKMVGWGGSGLVRLDKLKTAVGVTKKEKNSLAISMLIKSIRIGWPAGMDAALEILNDGLTKAICWAQVFEDIYPAADELKEVGDEIERLDFTALCARQSHHGQPKEVTKGWYANKDAAFPGDKVVQYVKSFDSRAKLSPRVMQCAYCWSTSGGGWPGLKRPVDETPWKGCPSVMLDMHASWAGKRGRFTILSGTWEQHVQISDWVHEKGWEFVRSKVHGSGIVPGTEGWELPHTPTPEPEQKSLL